MSDKKQQTLGWNANYFGEPKEGSLAKTIADITNKQNNLVGGKPEVADSQVATRWGNITDFKAFDLITPNEKEARFSLADQDASISNLTRQLFEKIKSKNIREDGTDRQRGTIDQKQTSTMCFLTFIDHR